MGRIGKKRLCTGLKGIECQGEGFVDEPSGMDSCCRISAV